MSSCAKRTQLHIRNLGNIIWTFLPLITALEHSFYFFSHQLKALTEQRVYLSLLNLKCSIVSLCAMMLRKLTFLSSAVGTNCYHSWRESCVLTFPPHSSHPVSSTAAVTFIPLISPASSCDQTLLYGAKPGSEEVVIVNPQASLTSPLPALFSLTMILMVLSLIHMMRQMATFKANPSYSVGPFTSAP